MVFKEALLVVLLLFILTWFFYMFIGLCIYNPLRYHYGKPKYRRNKDGYVEYFNYLHNRWELLTEWDSNESERKIILHTGNETPIDISYKGPGRCKMYIECDMTQKGFRSQFNFKSTEEIYNFITEQINNEDIITSKILKERVKYTI